MAFSEGSPSAPAAEYKAIVDNRSGYYMGSEVDRRQDHVRLVYPFGHIHLYLVLRFGDRLLLIATCDTEQTDSPTGRWSVVAGLLQASHAALETMKKRYKGEYLTLLDLRGIEPILLLPQSVDLGTAG